MYNLVGLGFISLLLNPYFHERVIAITWSIMITSALETVNDRIESPY